MRRCKTVLSALLPLVLAGCATSALKLAPAHPNRPWTPVTDAAGEIQPGKPASESGDDYVLPSNAALSALPPPPSALSSDHLYTLAELIDVAESNNPDTRVAWDSARNAALAAGIAESAYLPHVTASVVAGYQVSDGRNSALGFSAGGNHSASGAISALSAEWLLYDFGQRDAVVEAAQQVSIGANIAFTAAHQQVIYNVSLAYFADAAAQFHVGIAARSLKNAETVETAAQERFKHGIGTVIETAQASQATAQARLVSVQAEGGAQNSHVALLAAIGISPLISLKAAPLARQALAPSAIGSVDKIVSAALARRPDMLAAYATQKASAANIRAAEADFLPKAFITTTGSYSSAGFGINALPSVGQQSPTFNLSSSQLGATVIAGITVPIYDGGVRDAVLGQARANVDKADALLMQTRNQAIRQIVAAQNVLKTSVSAYEAATVLEKASQTSFDAALAAYRNRVGSITDVTVSEIQLLQAGNAAADAYTGARSAAVTVAFFAGGLGSAFE
jgi:outer membrane protein